MAESSVLSKEEPLTPNICEVVAVWIFRRRAQTAKKWQKLDLSILVFDFFASAPSSVCDHFSGTALAANEAPENLNVLGLSEAGETIPLNLAQAISPYKSGPMHFGSRV